MTSTNATIARDDTGRSRPRRRPALDLALIASFAALIAACAVLPAIQLGGLVPVTLQTFGVLLAGAVLGPRRGFLAVLLYLALGAIGLPVFSGGAAGLGVFAGPTAGYLVAFPIAALLCGAVVERLPRRSVAHSIPLLAIAGVASSLLTIHPMGIAGLVLLGGMPLEQAAFLDLAFIPGDIVKNVVMALAATAVHRAFPELLLSRR